MIGKVFLCSLMLLIALVLGLTKVDAASTEFDKAVELYKSGDYAKALPKFVVLSRANPADVDTHYYLALCHFCLVQLPQAKSEYLWVLGHTKDPALKAIAQESIQRVARYKGGTGKNRGPWPAPPPIRAGKPVRQVMEFYTDWCTSCKKFAKTFDMASVMFKGRISFKRFNAEDPANWKLVAKYHVTNYPTLVYLDSDGKVLENYAASPIGMTFIAHLRELGAER